MKPSLLSPPLHPDHSALDFPPTCMSFEREIGGYHPLKIPRNPLLNEIHMSWISKTPNREMTTVIDNDDND